MELKAALYLVPVNISDAPFEDVLPVGNLNIIKHIRHFIVENVRTARRFLRRCDKTFPIDDSVFYELNGHTDLRDVSAYLEPLRNGTPMAVMSEAGCPAIADPGAYPVEIAQREGLTVIPMVGPSSILLSLMASGFNGQGFAFNGYLPIDDKERLKALRELENICMRRSQTQIFIETPYRNNNMVRFLAENLRPDTMMCVACDITDPERQQIITRQAAKWRNCNINYDKRPAIFLIHRADIPTGGGKG